jgi:threonine/homoserine/homoserine lactone efflux protein
MLNAIGQVVPEAAMIALSPFPIVGLIMILFTKEAHTNSLLFLLGWLFGLLTVATIVLLLVRAGIIGVGQATVDAGIKWGSVVFGLVLLLLAYRYWQKRPKTGETAATPGWMDKIDAITPGGAFGLGVLLSAINPKSSLLALSAVLTIVGADLNTATTIITTLAFILLASITVIGLVVYVHIAGSNAEHLLNTAKTWLIQHNAALTAAIFLALGIKLVWQGFQVA